MHDDWARQEQANLDITIGCLSLNLTDHVKQTKSISHPTLTIPSMCRSFIRNTVHHPHKCSKKKLVPVYIATCAKTFYFLHFSNKPIDSSLT